MAKREQRKQWERSTRLAWDPCHLTSLAGLGQVSTCLRDLSEYLAGSEGSDVNDSINRALLSLCVNQRAPGARIPLAAPCFHWQHVTELRGPSNPCCWRCRQLWQRMPRLHFHVGESQPSSQPWQAGSVALGAVVRTESPLFSGQTRLTHPESPLLLGVLGCPGTEHCNRAGAATCTSMIPRLW